jgi:hypothetical protein
MSDIDPKILADDLADLACGYIQEIGELRADLARVAAERDRLRALCKGFANITECYCDDGIDVPCLTCQFIALAEPKL